MRGVLLSAAMGMVAGMAAASCGPTTFACTSDAQCLAAGADGMCQETGFCSFPDDACASRQRYGEHAGTLANKCAPPATADTEGGQSGLEGGGTDGPDDDRDNDDDDDPGPADDDDPGPIDDDDDDDDDDTGTPSETGGGSSADDGGGVTDTYDPCDAACDAFCVSINGGEVCTHVCDVDAQDCPGTAILPSGDYPLTCISFFGEGVCAVTCSLDTDCPADTACRDPYGEGICLYDAPPDEPPPR